MNRQEVEDLVNEQLRNAANNLSAIDDFFKDFKTWIKAIRNDRKNLLSNEKSGKTAIPTTPGASLRLRRRLSTVEESPDKVVSDKRRSRNALKNFYKSKVNEYHSKKAKLSFAIDDSDCDTVNSDNLSTFSQDSLNIPVALTSNDAQENVEQVDEQEKREASVRSNRSEHNIYGKKGNASQNAHSNPKTPSRSPEKLDCVNQEKADEIPTFKEAVAVTPSNVFTGQKKRSVVGSRGKENSNIVIVFEEPVASTQESSDAVTGKREASLVGNRGRRKVSSVMEVKRRITRGTVRLTRNASRANFDDLSQDSLDTLPDTIQASTSQCEQNCSGSQENGEENIDSMRRSKPSSVPRKASSVIRTSRQSSTLKRDVGERKSEELVADNICKQVSVTLVRVDEKVLSISCNKEVPRISINASTTHRNSGSTVNEHSTKNSVERKKSSDSRKRSLSSEEFRPNKKPAAGRSVKKVMHMNEIETEAIDIISQDLHKSQNENSESLKLVEQNGNSLQYKEVMSFAEISSPISDVNDKEIFESVVKDDSNDIADSGKGNSDSDVESSKYYSLVESGNNTQDKGKEKESVAERRTKTPDRRVSRKGAKSPALFSPYANEPVRNRVAAYEVLSTLAEEDEVPKSTKRVTRTKTRAMAAAAAAKAAATAAAAAAAASTSGNVNISANTSHLNKSNTKSHPTLKIRRHSWKKKLAAVAKKNDASKENSQLYSTKKTVPGKYYTPSGSGKILGDVNGLSSSLLNSSRKTPLNGPKPHFVNSSSGQMSKSSHKQGMIVISMDTFINKPTKVVVDSEAKKLEELKKREEKEKEAQRRREEFLRKQAEEKRKKRDEMRQRVQEKREAQEKEKQECQLRVGREKDEKWNVFQQEREAKQKGNVLKKKLESERKAAEARRKLEEAEAARIAKLKLEEQQRKREQEEAEREQLRLIAEEKETALLREKTEQKLKELTKAVKERAEMQKLTIPLVKIDGKEEKVLDSTFTVSHDTTFTLPTSPKKVVKTGKKSDNAFDLEELQSGDSEDEEDLPKKTARWASKSELLKDSKREIALLKKAHDMFWIPAINISDIFPSKRMFSRTSSAIWNTPPRYSLLPKY